MYPQWLLRHNTKLTNKQTYDVTAVRSSSRYDSEESSPFLQQQYSLGVNLRLCVQFMSSDSLFVYYCLHQHKQETTHSYLQLVKIKIMMFFTIKLSQAGYHTKVINSKHVTLNLVLSEMHRQFCRSDEVAWVVYILFTNKR